MRIVTCTIRANQASHSNHTWKLMVDGAIYLGSMLWTFILFSYTCQLTSTVWFLLHLVHYRLIGHQILWYCCSLHCHNHWVLLRCWQGFFFSRTLNQLDRLYLCLPWRRMKPVRQVHDSFTASHGWWAICTKWINLKRMHYSCQIQL